MHEKKSALHQATRSRWFFQGILAVLILAFALTSLDKLIPGSSNYVLIVQNKKINMQDLQLLLRQDFLMNVIADSAQPTDIFSAIQKTKDNLVLDALCAQCNVHVSEQEALRSLHKSSAFEGDNGQFSSQKMRKILAQYSMNTGQIIAAQKKHIARARLVSALKSGVKLPETFSKLIQKGFVQKRSGLYKNIPWISVKAPSEAAIKVYWSQKKPMTVERRTLSYVMIDRPKVEKFLGKQAGKTWHVVLQGLTKNFPKAPIGEIAKFFHTTPQTIVMDRQVKKPHVFEANLDPQIQAAIYDTLWQAGFAMQPQHGTWIVPVAEGYAVALCVNKIIPPQPISYEQGRDSLIAAWKKEQSRSLTQKIAENFKNNLRQQEMVACGPETYDTQSLQEAQPQSTMPNHVKKALFSLKPKQSTIVETEQGLTVVQLTHLATEDNISHERINTLHNLAEEDWKGVSLDVLLLALEKQMGVQWNMERVREFMLLMAGRG